MLTARMMKRVLHGRYCLVMDQLIRKDIHLSSPGSPLEKTLAQHRPPTLLLQGFHTWADMKTQVSFLLSLLKQIVNSFISTRRILLLLGLFWFSNLSKSWRINRIADFQQPTYTVLLVHAHRFLFWVHSQAKFWYPNHICIFFTWHLYSSGGACHRWLLKGMRGPLLALVKPGLHYSFPIEGPNGAIGGWKVKDIPVLQI